MMIDPQDTEPVGIVRRGFQIVKGISAFLELALLF
jgi:hypothetical protein